MKSMPLKFSHIGLALVLAILLALASVMIERTGPEQVAYGNLCGAAAADPCYQPALKAGFPFAYLVDAPGVSVERQLAVGEDTLNAGKLILDIGAYFIACLLAIRFSSGRLARKRIA